LPITGSHEPTGVVEECGPDVKGFQKGDRVGATAFVAECGQCPDCKAGRPLYCDNASMGGINTHGAFAEYVVVDSKMAAHLPDNLSFDQAAPLTCAGCTIYNGLKACELKEGQSVGIVGLGALGHIGIQLAKTMGYKVVGVDARDEPIKLANSLKYKPDLCINTTKGVDEAWKQIEELTKDEAYPGLDAVVVATDHPDSFAFATKILRKHGLFVLLGQPAEGVTFQYFDLIFRDIKVKGSLLGDQACLQELMDLVAEKGIKIETQSFKLDQVNEVTELVHKPEHKGKMVISFE